MSEKNTPEELIKRYLDGNCTPEEKALVESWHLLDFKNSDENPSMQEINAAHEQMRHTIMAHAQHKTRSLWPRRIAAAASILLILSAGGYFLFKNKATVPPQTASIPKTDIPPGNQSAILQLSNGQQISLNQVKAGTIATQGSTNITKTANNSIVYNNDNNNENTGTATIAYNTITTKRGNYYPLTLSDGTVAILDAGSSIRYPVVFTGSERKVEITGQVYFEVTHNSKMPFRVSVKGQTIEDLGTHFNINAYDDEPNIKTTLIEGSIRINNEKTLIPGQQAVITNGNIRVKKADIEQAIAWKNGLFNFEGMPLADAMRQISRWYDVDVEYPEGTPRTVFHGEMHRNVNALQVLEVLKFFKVNFEIVQGFDGKKILVKP
ncbi:FecR domain-containing protein [Mucilaginibacter mali]|uniref:FecR domain-containing protein n=1 Tax=Mucilaginibacter mali TaxID=2740462 RepID=A0A7D4U0D3_9SPHI|nr:FecR family protein [Mucilaginibacter mali]QKJ32857.1 FecR domain-containing protein [Mucilaginibacter mali]